ncbi:MAG TPA: hypothetical protein VJ783_32270 [Pirellulales bacterium]|nr:hypothetical protein [Pirellulales bacterium]
MFDIFGNLAYNALVTQSALHGSGDGSMAPSKTAFLNMRVSPATKRALREIAERENRSMANALEWLVAEYLSKNGVQASREAQRERAK